MQAFHTPRVSLCIPTFNGALFLADTLQSIRAQVFTHFEVIITDDQSTDQTLTVVEPFLNDQRFRLMKNRSNIGMARNWANALSYARGYYVKLLGQDDLLHPECLSRQLQALDRAENSSAALAVCNRLIIDGLNRTIFRRRFPFENGIISGSKLIRQSLLRGANLIGEPVVGLFRRHCLNPQSLPRWGNSYYLDLALWVELLRNGDAYIDSDFLASFRISRKAATSTIGLRQAAHFHQFSKALRLHEPFRLGRLAATTGSMLAVIRCILRNAFIAMHSRKIAQPTLSRTHNRKDQGLLDVAYRSVVPKASENNLI